MLTNVIHFSPVYGDVCNQTEQQSCRREYFENALIANAGRQHDAVRALGLCIVGRL